MKKTHKEVEARIHRIINRYKDVLLLGDRTWKVKHGCENKSSLMECVFNYPYLNVTLKYSDELIDKFKAKEDLKEYVIHEMCHPITDPLYSKAFDRFGTGDELKDARERLTDHICNIVVINKL